jgi:signal transduction histidine kinase
LALPEDSLEEIFEPYVRLEHGREAYRDGSGLGLGIARRIARQHGGDVKLVNRDGGGLVARLSLPAASADASVAIEGASSDP